MFAGRDQVNPVGGTECAKDVYAQAGITDPRKEIDVVEMYVPFSWFEPMWLENLLFAGPGEGWRMVEDGVTQLDGDLPLAPYWRAQCLQLFVAGEPSCLHADQLVRASSENDLAAAVGDTVRDGTEVLLLSDPLDPNSKPGDPDAAFTEENNGSEEEINTLSKQGYLIRTRADSDTEQARTNDGSRRDLSLRSGAQLVSTDYPKSEPAKWDGHYFVAMPADAIVRCNPVNAPADCKIDPKEKP